MSYTNKVLRTPSRPSILAIALLGAFCVAWGLADLLKPAAKAPDADMLPETAIDAMPPAPTGAVWRYVLGVNVTRAASDTCMIATGHGPHHTMTLQAFLGHKTQFRVSMQAKANFPTVDLYLEARDTPAKKGGASTYYATSFYDLAQGEVTGAGGDTVTRGIENGADGWKKLWMDEATEDGYVDLQIRLSAPHNVIEFGAAGQQLCLRDIEITPLP